MGPGRGVWLFNPYYLQDYPCQGGSVNLYQGKREVPQQVHTGQNMKTHAFEVQSYDPGDRPKNAKALGRKSAKKSASESAGPKQHA